MRVEAIGTGRIAARIIGIALKSASAQQIAAIEDAVSTFGVLHFPAQPLADDEQLELSARFGALNMSFIDPEKRRASDPRLNEVSNLTLDGQARTAGDEAPDYNDTNLLWHSDLSFKKPAARLTFLNARELPAVPPPTEFTDMRAAWRALSPEMQRRIDTLEADHDVIFARAKTGYTDFTEQERSKVPPVRHRLVRRDRRSGEPALYLSSSASQIVGMDLEEGRALIDELLAVAGQERFRHVHHWQIDDLLIWNNLATMHRAVAMPPTGEKRVLRWSAALEPDDG